MGKPPKNDLLLNRTMTVKNIHYRALAACFSLLIMLSACGDKSGRERELFTSDWRFSLSDDSTASQIAYTDTAWRTLNLPHDWSIEGEFRVDNPAKPEGGALPTGVAWYRKTFVVPASSSDKSVFIEFDGVYRNSSVWINGHYLGKRASGYSSFRYELTPYLKFGKKEENILAVRVDNSAQPNSRWYTGSGIYRNVWLVTTGRIAVDHWGSFVTSTPGTDGSAAINLKLQLRKAAGESDPVRITTQILAEDGAEVARAEADALTFDSVATPEQTFTIANAHLWTIERPYLYKAVTSVYQGKKLSDVYETPFGVRSFAFDSLKGFSLNGKPTKILGVCNHHDLGALGAAVNVRAMQRQLEILKAMGCNAIRMAHNPPAPELLDLCDRMGFLVMDEAFDMWRKKKTKQDYHVDWDTWHTRDLRDMVLRDRNHPSIILWSIGNEIREQFDSTGITITRELANLVKSLDNTRPVTSALTETVPEKNFIYQSGALDVLGFNYKQQDYVSLPKRFPGAKLIGAETMSALATRGSYNMPSDSVRRWPVDFKTPLTTGNADWTVSAYDNVSAYWGSTHEETWKLIKRYDFMAGLFVWTGFDYLGEPIPYPWPARSSYFGIVDMAGFPKDAYYLYQSEWTDKPVLHVFPHWNWTPGQTVDVWAYYNQADLVELFVNGVSQGIRQKSADTLHAKWRVKYVPGTMKAVSRKNGAVVLEHEVRTAGRPARIVLEADRTLLRADGQDLSFVKVSIVDEKGTLVPYASNRVTFTVTGEGVLAGTDNGYPASHESFQGPQRQAFNGLCLAIIRASRAQGSITVQATAAGLAPAHITLETK